MIRDGVLYLCGSANVAAVRDEPVRLISVHVSLTPPTIAETSPSQFDGAEYFYQWFCQLPFHLMRLFLDKHFIPMKETCQTSDFSNHSVKNLEYPAHFPSCSLSLF